MIAEFNRIIPHPIESVWRMLTVNEQLQKWFPQLKIEQLQPDGKIRFDFGNGSYEEMTLLKVSEPSSLAFTWDTNIMRFELSGTAEGKLLRSSAKTSSRLPRIHPRISPAGTLAWKTSLLFWMDMPLSPVLRKIGTNFISTTKMNSRHWLKSRKRNHLSGTVEEPLK
ncbi:SRPBCC domain-containing protein [Trichococcus shcherbakoviae]|uniref:SRPBCC domain-containing protein n=1 Tax=Trichococcus shcherbakoviae TaxID=2094020 RepID=UPI003520A2B9